MLGALLLALGASRRAGAPVRLVRWLGGVLDLGLLDPDDGLVDFSGRRAELKSTLLNHGLAALLWVLVGRWGGRLLAGPEPSRGPGDL